ncbi:3-oxo-5a-steroid 4- dehydrogenase [Clydaea vesicula]|uniref:very-long-chain enoyl-CoA reductase n=1 Tax=Clydaea vesicula TaxID=447962 RepID=A0AAD5Y1H4_9FUNG|nr:3-oxo-5a-steroid 4- dehydrogenase [Clydaea vesicula]KAJ3386698.1 3-oxo-5a-steroid 4- dehydrogenase [Lobulomyces angularis]
MINLVVKDRKGKVLLPSLELDELTSTVSQINSKINQKFKHMYPSRQRLTFENKVLQKEDPISKFDFKNGDVIQLKDLGPQIGWTTVFLIEYFGPIFIHPLFYFFPNIFYPGYAEADYQKSNVQALALIMVVLHFLKREFETIFVHRFSSETMPYTNLPKNCFHYWVLGGFNLAYWIYKPNNAGYFKFIWTKLGFENGIDDQYLILATLIALWTFAQLSNYKTHCILRDLRPPGLKTRKIPQGYGFNLVSCPNYFFEMLGWFVISLMTNSLASYMFFFVGAAQMTDWAVKKHLRYKKDFKSEYPKNRKILFPFIF